MIEILESRIAPAVTIPFTDLDGDAVTITSSKGTLQDLQTAAGDLSDNQLQELNLTGGNGVFEGANISIVARQSGTGDGRVNVGSIKGILALDIDVALGNVVVDGDLGSITSTGIKSLTVLSMGRFGTTTGAVTTGAFFDGPVGKVVIQTDLVNARFHSVSGPRAHSIASLFIGGSVIGDDDSASSFALGQIRAGSIGSVFIGGDLAAASGNISGAASILLVAPMGGGTATLGSLVVKGSIIGGLGSDSGKIGTQVLGKATIGVDVRGGGGPDSGMFEITKSAGAISIGGSLLGGAGTFSGAIDASAADATLTTVKIGRNVVGNAGDDSASILSGGGIKSVLIGNDFLGGTGNRSGRINASVEGIGALMIRHDFEGGTGAGTSAGEIFTAGGIGSVFVGGNVIGGTANRNGLIQGVTFINKATVVGNLVGGTVAGADKGTIYSNGTLGAVTVLGDVIGGSGSEDGSIVGKTIGSVKVGGDVIGGTGQLSGAIFTIVGQQGNVGSVTIAGGLIGMAFNSGRIYSDGDLGTVKVGADLKAGTGSFSGYIEGGRIKSVLIGGSMLGSPTELISNAARIAARVDLGSVIVGGRMEGGPGNFAIISAVGAPSPTATTDLAIKSVKIGGNFENAGIYAGANAGIVLTNANAQLGSVLIGGSMMAPAKIAAGLVFGPPPATGISKIASVVVRGSAGGEIVSHKLGSVKIGDAVADLTGGADDLALGQLSIRDVV